MSAWDVNLSETEDKHVRIYERNIFGYIRKEDSGYRYTRHNILVLEACRNVVSGKRTR